MNSKFLTVERLKEVVENYRKENKKTVFTNGCFDILHIGHINLLATARKLGDVLIVAVNSDRSVQELKGPERPIITLEERMEIIAALEMVDFVTTFDSRTCQKLLRRIKPEIYVKGGDYTPASLLETEVVRGYGGKLEIIDQVKKQSTSKIIRKIKGLDS